MDLPKKSVKNDKYHFTCPPGWYLMHYISREFFSQLNKEAVKGLYDKYVIDMEMWDYLIEPYLSYAGMVSWSKLNTWCSLLLQPLLSFTQSLKTVLLSIANEFINLPIISSLFQWILFHPNMHQNRRPHSEERERNMNVIVLADAQLYCEWKLLSLKFNPHLYLPDWKV